MVYNDVDWVCDVCLSIWNPFRFEQCISKPQKMVEVSYWFYNEWSFQIFRKRIRNNIYMLQKYLNGSDSYSNDIRKSL